MSGSVQEAAVGAGHRRKGVALLLLAAVVTGCASFDPHGVYQRQSPGNATSTPRLQPLDAAARAEGFDRVWHTLRERYVDPTMRGTDWAALGEHHRRQALEASGDTDYWTRLDALAGELRDGHTRVESPRQIQLRERHGRLPYGFDLRLLEGQLTVSSVDPRSAAAQAGVRPGLALLRADGEDAPATWIALRRQVRPSSTPQAEDLMATQEWFGRWPDGPVVFEFAAAESAGDAPAGLVAPSSAAPLRVPLLRQERPSTRVASRVLPTGFGYLAFAGFESRVENEVMSALRGFRAAPGLIVDLRGNRGGSFRVAQRLAGALVPTARDFGRTRTRTGEPITMHFGLTELIGRQLRVEPPPSGAYAGPIVVLIDSASASGSEFLAGALRALGRARLIGQTSCGCLLGVLGPLPLPGGGRLSFSEVDFELDGLPRIEGVGLQPDESVPATLADLQRGHDAALAAAEAWLLQATRAANSDRMSPVARPAP